MRHPSSLGVRVGCEELCRTAILCASPDRGLKRRDGPRSNELVFVGCRLWTVSAWWMGGQVTGQLQACHRGDRHVVNCLEQHPHLPLVIATSGCALGNPKP